MDRPAALLVLLPAAEDVPPVDDWPAEPPLALPPTADEPPGELELGALLRALVPPVVDCPPEPPLAVVPDPPAPAQAASKVEVSA